MEVGSLDKGKYDSEANAEEGLALEVGNIVLVTKVLGKHRSLIPQDEKQISFSVNYVKKLEIPPLHDNQELYAPVCDYISENPDDLSFKKGDLVIGLRPVDGNWWEGQLDGMCGIFPLTYVWKIDRKILKKSLGLSNLVAHVEMGLKAQDEIDLTKGDIVQITEKNGQGWYRGECNGRTGKFLASCADVVSNGMNDSENSTVIDSGNQNHKPAKEHQSNSYGYDCVSSGISSCCLTIHEFKAAMDDELSFPVGKIISLFSDVNNELLEGEFDGKRGRFPKNRVLIVDCSSEIETSSDNIKTEKHLSELYSNFLKDFDEHLKSQVKSMEGIRVEQRIDNDWVRVRTRDGKTPVYPIPWLKKAGLSLDSIPPPYSDVAKPGMVNSSLTAKGSNSCDRPISHSPTSLDQQLGTTKSDSTGLYDFPFEASQSIDAESAENISFLDSSISSESSLSGSHDSSSKSSSFMNDQSPSIHDRSDISSNSSLSLPSLVAAPINGGANNMCKNLFGIKEDGLNQQISELKQKISEKETEMKNLITCRSKLEKEKQSTQDDAKLENFLKSDVIRFNKEIQNLNIEINTLKKKLQLLDDDSVTDSSAQSTSSAAASDGGPSSSEAPSERKEDEERRQAEEREKRLNNKDLVLLWRYCRQNETTYLI